MKYSAVLFDLDGTLLYTLEDIAAALNRALSAHGMPTLALDRVCASVGNGSKCLVELAVPAGTDQALADSVLRFYRADYDHNCDIKTRPYDGIPELLDTLKDRGVKLAVVSNKPDGAVKALATAHFPGIFTIAVGRDRGCGANPRRMRCSRPWRNLELKRTRLCMWAILKWTSRRREMPV